MYINNIYLKLENKLLLYYLNSPIYPLKFSGLLIGERACAQALLLSQLL